MLAVSNITLSDDTLQELSRLTEGWPAAVALAALSLVGRPDRAEAEEFVHRLSGSDRFVADYLSEEVLGGQEPELRDFLLDMSVFDRFNAALANEAAQISSAAGLLHRLERDNAFLIPLPEAGWYRFHHLFAAYAQATLEVEYPERVVDLHRRGARWLASHDHPEDAIGHLLAAGDTDEAAQLIQRHWVRYVDAGRSVTVTGWLHGLRGTPADLGAAATVTGAWMAALTGDPPELRRRLAALENMTTPTALPDGTMSPRSGLLMIRGLVGSDGPDRMLIDAQDAVALENNPASPWHAVRGPSWARPHSSPATFGWHDTTLPRPPQRRSPRRSFGSSPTPSSRCARPSKATVQPAGGTRSWPWPSSPTTRCRLTRTCCPPTPPTAPPWPPRAAYPPRWRPSRWGSAAHARRQDSVRGR